MRQSYIAGNWKMHKTVGEAKELASALKQKLTGSPHKFMIAPPFTALSSVAPILQGSNILLGAQNMASEEQGAHTGEISVLMLKDLGVQAVILGHSERRHVYGENDALINAKVRLALRHALEVILCVGETIDEREAGKAEAVVKEQLEKGLAEVDASSLPSIVIAYEPVWAIGTGKTATPDDADAMHAFIRKVLGERYGSAAAQDMVIQYGGSVKPDNAKGLMGMENIDGALVGGASLKTDTFVPIARYDE